MTETSLDDIMSGRGEAVPGNEPTPTPDTPAAPAPVEGSRDDKGRFAAKPGPAEAAAATPPATPDAPVQQPGHVPIQALDSERNKRKELEDRYEKDMRELRDQLARLSQPAKPAEPAAPPPTIWDSPDEYFASQLTPIQQQVFNQKAGISQMLASEKHGADKVNAALQAAMAIKDTPEGRMLDAKLESSIHPFEEMVKWHAEQSFKDEVGADPDAYKQRVIQEYLASQQQQPQPTPAAPAPLLPTSFANKPTSGPRGGQEYGGPRSLSEIMGGR